MKDKKTTETKPNDSVAQIPSVVPCYTQECVECGKKLLDSEKVKSPCKMLEELQIVGTVDVCPYCGCDDFYIDG